MAGNEDAVRLACLVRQATADEIRRHQPAGLGAEIVHRPGEVVAGEPLHHLAQPPLGEMAGQEGEARHWRRRSTAAASSAIEATTSTPSNSLRRSTLSRSMRRGNTLTMPPGAMVRSSGAVSQAKTMIGMRHFPAWAKTLVARLSEMP